MPTSFRSLLSALSVSMTLLPASSAAQLPVVNAPVVVVSSTSPTNMSSLEIIGSGFGVPSPTSQLRLNVGTQFTYNATDPEIKSWTDTRIVAQVARAISSGTLRVRNAVGWSVGNTPIDTIYNYTTYKVPTGDNDPDPSLRTNAIPFAIALDASSRVWINQEFHASLQVWAPGNPPGSEVATIALPHPPGPGPFAMFSPLNGADQQTRLSQSGEDIVVDVDGSVWFTEGGGGSLIYDGDYPNHSRIVRYDPAAQTFRVFNIPGDNNMVWGLAIDRTQPANPRVWFTSNAHESEVYSDLGRVVGHVGAKLTSFNPNSSTLYNAPLDYSSQSKNLICLPNADDTNCYHEYEIPEAFNSWCGNSYADPKNTLGAAHIAVDPSGFIWYTSNLGGNSIGRLNRTTGAIVRFPLPKSIGGSATAIHYQSAPWQIAARPNGDIVFTQESDSTIARFVVSRMATDPNGCTELVNGSNPCVDELVIPDADLYGGGVHSIAFDASGKTWFTEAGSARAGRLTSIGYVTADWQAVIRFPPLGVFAGSPHFAGAGIAVHPGTGDLWFADYRSQRLCRLQRVQP
jgi:streptogramin lyase